jgi:DNA-binding transcriptional LysR family regulator
MALNFKQLEAFVWAVDLGSFSKAAARLNTTQPNISIRIKALESALQVTLLDRDAGSVRLTTRGQHLLEQARHILHAADNLVASMEDTSLIDSTLRLGVTEMIVHTWLQPLLKTLKEQFPRLHVELTIDLSANLSKDLYARSIDLSFQNGPFERSISGSVELGIYPLIWIASPKLGLCTANEISTESLTANPILTHARDTALFTEVSRHLKQVGVHDAHLVPSSNLAACLFMAINAMGVATLPREMVSTALKRQDVVEISYPWSPNNLEFVARYDEGRSPPHVAEIARLAKQVAANYARHPEPDKP